MTITLQTAAAGWMPPRRWTRDEYYRAAELGIFRPDARLELIEGEVLSKMSPIGAKHVVAVHRTARVLEAAADCKFLVRTQSPFILSDESEPEPDVCVVNFREDEYVTEHPSAADIALVVEVSDSSLAFDRSRKASLYAGVLIPEYWIVNIERMEIEVYRDPAIVVGYRSKESFDRTSSLSPLFAPQSLLVIAEILPMIREAGFEPSSFS